MNIRIETPIARLIADLTQEQVAEILGIALDYAVGLDNRVTPEPKTIDSVVETAPAPDEPVHSIDPKVPEPHKAEFKGFLYLKCEACGKFKGFMPRTPISEHRCECGHITPLKDLKVIRLNCKCGVKFKYLTNATDSIITMDCYNCGSPVDLEYHERKQEYVTIGTE